MTPQPPTQPPAPPDPAESWSIRPYEILAASFGSVIGAAVTSRFGIAGTLVGAAVAPVFVMVSVGALAPRIHRGISRSVEAGRQLTQAWDVEGGRGWRWAAGHPREFAGRIRALGRRQATLALAAASLAFGLGLVAITAFEAIVGEPISSIGRSGAKGGTTLSPDRQEDPLEVPKVPDQEAEPRPAEEEEREGAATETAPPPTETAPPPTTTTPEPATTQPGEGLGSEQPTTTEP